MAVKKFGKSIKKSGPEKVANTIIETKDLEKVYDLGEVKLYALKGVSLGVKEGEFLAVMGSSGSGKSTFLHQVGLLDIPSGGSIVIDKEDVSHLDEMERNMFRLTKLGYVFQDYAILPELTALENVYLPMKMNGANKEECVKRATDLLNKVGLGDRINHLPTELSGGQQQRVSIARALVNSPKILFADEPCANLDTESSEQILELFKKLNREMKQTIVMVTHEEWHKKYVDRIIYLKDGAFDREER
jgi:putative ABC transport system ATP-binding protein